MVMVAGAASTDDIDPQHHTNHSNLTTSDMHTKQLHTREELGQQREELLVQQLELAATNGAEERAEQREVVDGVLGLHGQTQALQRGATSAHSERGR